MSTLSLEMEEIYARALDELFALGRDLSRGSFRLIAEKYEIKECTLRTKYWQRTAEKPSPFLRAKRITIGDIRFESNPFQIAEAIKLLIRRLNAAEDENRRLQTDLDGLSVKYAALEEKSRESFREHLS